MPKAPETQMFSQEELRKTKPLSQEDLAYIDPRASAKVGMPVAELLGKVGRTLHDLNAQRNASPLAGEELPPDHSELRNLIEQAKTAFEVIQSKLITEAPTQEEIDNLTQLEEELEKRLGKAA